MAAGGVHTITVPAGSWLLHEGLHPTARGGQQAFRSFRVDREPVCVGSFAGYVQRYADKPFAVVGWSAAGLKLVSRVASEAAAQRLLEKMRAGRGLSHTIERLVPDAARLRGLTTSLAPTAPLIGATLLEAWGYLAAADKTLLTPLQWSIITHARLYSGGAEFADAATLDEITHAPRIMPPGCAAYTTAIGAEVYINTWEWVLPTAAPAASVTRLPQRRPMPGIDEAAAATAPSPIGRAALACGAMRRAVPRFHSMTAVMFRGVSEDTSITMDERTAVPRAAPPAPAEEEPLLRVASGGRRR